MADRKLTEVIVASTAKDTDYFVLLQDKVVKQIALSSLDLGGGTVMEIELRKNGDYIEWKSKDSKVWHQLFPLSDVKGEKGEPGINGVDGKPGRDGIDGQDGTNGITPTFSIGTVEAVENNQPAKVIISGTSENVILNFKIPKGLNGNGSGDVTTSQLNTAIKENVTDKNFLQSTIAENTYLKKQDAETTYAKKTEITNFVTNTELNNAIKTNITDQNFLKTSVAESNYLKKSDSEKYIDITELNKAFETNVTSKNFITSTFADSTYLKKTDADNKYAKSIDIPFKIKKITQSDYDGLQIKDENTLYLIVG